MDDDGDVFGAVDDDGDEDDDDDCDDDNDEFVSAEGDGDERFFLSCVSGHLVGSVVSVDEEDVT